jgi:hypothetical protein
MQGFQLIHELPRDADLLPVGARSSRWPTCPARLPSPRTSIRLRTVLTACEAPSSGVSYFNVATDISFWLLLRPAS